MNGAKIIERMQLNKLPHSSNICVAAQTSPYSKKGYLIHNSRESRLACTQFLTPGMDYKIMPRNFSVAHLRKGAWMLDNQVEKMDKLIRTWITDVPNIKQ